MSHSILRTIKSVRHILEDKEILPKCAWSPSFDFHFSDKEDFAKKMIVTVIADVGMLENQREEIGANVNRYQQEVRAQRKRLEDVEKRIDAIKSSFSIEEKKKEIDKVMGNLLIQGYEFVDPAVTIFTTEFLRKGNIIIGVYRIWIDWSRSFYKDAIKIINVYKSAEHHDHPCLSNASLCVGTFGPLLERAYQEKNLFGLLETIMAFLAQENPPSGYYHSWGEWDRDATKRNSDFSFRHYGISPGQIDSNRQNTLMQQPWYRDQIATLTQSINNTVTTAQTLSFSSSAHA